MRSISFIERSGNRIMRTGSVCAPDLSGYTCTPGCDIEEVPSVVDLPAAWVDGQAVYVGQPPTQAHYYDYELLRWVLDVDAAWALVRAQRDQLISETSWRVERAMESGIALSEAWLSYRQALRDITTQSDVLNIQWPQVPKEDA